MDGVMKAVCECCKSKAEDMEADDIGDDMRLLCVGCFTTIIKNHHRYIQKMESAMDGFE